MRSIIADELVRWIRQMRARYAPHTVHNYWGALHLVLAYAARRGLIAGNPAERLTPSERPSRAAAADSRDEMIRLLESVPDRYRAAIACALFSGLRLSGLLGLVWRVVDFERGVLYVTHQLARDGSRKQLKTPAARCDVVLMPELAAPSPACVTVLTR